MKFFILALSLASLSATAGAANASSPAGVIDHFHETLIAGMQGGNELGCKGRAEKLKPVIDQTYDIPFLAEKVLRRDWGKLSAKQRKQFTHTLHDLVITTYAFEFSSFNDETFETLKTQDMSQGRKLVRTRLQIPGDPAVSFDYLLQKRGGQWRVVNVITEGISDLAVRAQQYSQALKERGFNGMISWLREQIKKNQTDC
ncbi:MAG: ABC transporter substrate-binding protein [Pseudomonadota bacterium]